MSLMPVVVLVFDVHHLIAYQDDEGFLSAWLNDVCIYFSKNHATDIISNRQNTVSISRLLCCLDTISIKMIRKY